MEHAQCTLCRRSLQFVKDVIKCPNCTSPYCSRECCIVDFWETRQHQFACYPYKTGGTTDAVNVVDVVDIASSFCEELDTHRVGPKYELTALGVATQHDNRQMWKIREGDALLTWETFTHKKSFHSQPQLDRHIRYCMYQKAKYAGHSDRIIVDLLSILFMLQQKGKKLQLYGKPVAGLYVITLDMTQTCCTFQIPLLNTGKSKIAHPLLSERDVKQHPVIGIKLEGDPTMYVLDLTMCLFGQNSFRQKDTIFLCALPRLFDESETEGIKGITALQLATSNIVKDMRQEVTAGSIITPRQLRTQQIISVLNKFK